MEELEKYKKENLRTRAIRNNEVVRNFIQSSKQQLLEAAEAGHFELTIPYIESVSSYKWVIFEVLKQETECDVTFTSGSLIFRF